MPTRAHTNGCRPSPRLWEGKGPAGACSITISGNSLHYSQPAADETKAEFWYETTFTLPAGDHPQQLHATILEDSSQKQRDIGKVVVALYKIEDETLTLGVINDFEGPVVSPVEDGWDRPRDLYHLKRVQP